MTIVQNPNELSSLSSNLDKKINQIVLGNCLEILSSYAEQSVNLIVTSPPYADSRKSTYGGIHPDHYVEWFLPISEQLFRVLKNDGSFILNIKEKALNAH